jgi:hypothetical protein
LGYRTRINLDLDSCIMGLVDAGLATIEQEELEYLDVANKAAWLTSFLTTQVINIQKDSEWVITVILPRWYQLNNTLNPTGRSN